MITNNGGTADASLASTAFIGQSGKLTVFKTSLGPTLHPHSSTSDSQPRLVNPPLFRRGHFSHFGHFIHPPPPPSSSTALWKYELVIPVHKRKPDASARATGSNFEDEVECARARDKLYLEYYEKPDPNRLNFPPSTSKKASSPPTSSSSSSSSSRGKQDEVASERRHHTEPTEPKHRGIRKVVKSKGSSDFKTRMPIEGTQTTVGNIPTREQAAPAYKTTAKQQKPLKIKGQKERPSKPPKCDKCGKEAVAHVWFDKWKGACYLGKCEACYVEGSKQKCGIGKGASKGRSRGDWQNESNYRGVTLVGGKRKVRP